jgi:hypothetical protein
VCSKRFIAFLKPPSGLLSSRGRSGGGHRHVNGFSLTKKAQEDVARALSILRSTCADKSRLFRVYLLICKYLADFAAGLSLRGRPEA